MDLNAKAAETVKIAQAGGRQALGYFRQLETLTVTRKGHQDFVSEADRNVETTIRAALGKAFPADAIVGEEHAPSAGASGFTWVIDPIDGTTNFVSGIPAWTVVIAGVQDGRTIIGAIHDPCHDETFVAVAGQGATLNGGALQLPDAGSLQEGSVGVGFSNRRSTDGIGRMVNALLAEGAVFQRNASGALSLAYVAAGRLLGYVEEHMNAWDCLAGQLLIAEAGGRVEAQDADRMINEGGRVIVGNKGVFDDLLRLADAAYRD